MGRHEAVIGHAVHVDWALHAEQDDLHRQLAVRGVERRSMAREGREGARQALARALVAGGAGAVVERLAVGQGGGGSVLGWFAVRAGGGAASVGVRAGLCAGLCAGLRAGSRRGGRAAGHVEPRVHDATLGHEFDGAVDVDARPVAVDLVALQDGGGVQQVLLELVPVQGLEAALGPGGGQQEQHDYGRDHADRAEGDGHAHLARADQVLVAVTHGARPPPSRGAGRSRAARCVRPGRARRARARCRPGPLPAGCRAG